VLASGAPERYDQTAPDATSDGFWPVVVATVPGVDSLPELSTATTS
jgi:hypothetical protein